MPKHVSWLTIVLAILAAGTFFAISTPDSRYYGTPTMMGEARMEYQGSSGAMPPTSVGAPMMDVGASNAYYPDSYPYPSPEVPVTDTREFLKVYYSASMRTRDAQGLTGRVATVVRGYDGRIDQESSSRQYGSISFALPQSKYDAFRTELEGLVDKRFLTVSISSQNLLSQKVSIEEQQTQANSVLADHKATRQRLIAAHTSTVQSLQARIDAATPQDDVTYLKQQLANENASYAKQLSYSDARIKSAEDLKKALETRDQALIDSVATVTGTVSIQWISLWDIAQLYLPGYWIPSIFAVLAFLSFLRDRRRFA